MNVVVVGILIELSREHQLDATSAAGSNIFPTSGSVKELSTALLTMYAMCFDAASPHT